MFESGLDASGTLHALTRLRRERLERECAELELVAHWADVSSTEHGLGEFASMELGAVLATSTAAADRLIVDATDLRHRWPHLWGLVRSGMVPAWKARRVAQTARHLDDTAILRLDAELDGLVTSLPWARFERILEAKIISVDPAQAEKQAELWAAEQFVRTGQTRGHGLKLLVARAAAGDVIWFLAMVNRIADILLVEGDLRPIDVRRARAIGILAQPALALDLLTRHRQPDQSAPDQSAPDQSAPDQSAPDQIATEHDDAAGLERPDNEALPGQSQAEPPTDSADVEPEPEPESDTHVSVRFAGPSDKTRIDPDKVAPKVVLHIHLSREALTSGAGVARIENVGPVTVGEVRDFLGTRTCRIRVQPVIDPTDITPVDAYEIPTRTAEAVRHRHPVEVFPYGTQPSRTADLDHTTPYQSLTEGGPPGQTRPDNLGPLSRRHHRAKTFGGWNVRQPEEGVFVWRSPHGYLFHVDHHGTHPLGTGRYAQTLWRAVTALDDRANRPTHVVAA